MIAHGRAGKLKTGNSICITRKASPKTGKRSAPISIWRPQIVWAGIAAAMVGIIATRVPEWIELAVGIPAITGIYCWIIWTRAFGHDDRVLFRKSTA